MVSVSFTYYEFIDKDFTGVIATLPACGRQPRQMFANFENASINKRIYANQSEEFHFPSRRSALTFLRSNAQFRQVPSFPECADD